MEPQYSSIPNIPEIILKIFLDLNYESILSLCATSKQFAVYCNDSLLWAYKAEQDFDFPMRLFDRDDFENPHQRYLQIRSYKLKPANYLSSAASHGDVDLVSWLAGQPQVKIWDLNLTLIAAVIGGHVPVVQFLLNHGATDLKETLTTAAEYGRLPVIRWLFENKANLLGRDPLNKALEIAAIWSHLPVVKWLVDHGATKLYDAFVSAARNGSLSVVQWLFANIKLNRNAAVNHALQLAALEGRLPVVKWLVKHGATNINNALQLAISTKKTAVINYLQSL